MLNIILDSNPTVKVVENIDAYFASVWEPSWIDTAISRAIIADVDKSKVVAPRIIDSPYLGYVDPTHLSGGTKFLLCMLYNEHCSFNMDLTVCGENCAKWIQRIGNLKDITVYLGYPMTFFTECKTPIRIVNSGRIVDNMSDFMDEYLRYGR